MDIESRQLSNALGAEILNVDLQKPLTQSTLDKIMDLFHRHQMIVFRNQSLTPEQQITACQQFGEIEPHPTKNPPWKYSEITYVANVDLNGNQYETCGPTFELWHSDLCYLEQPAKMSCLYAEKVPPEHGETLFANMYEAYEQLSHTFKEKIEKLSATFGSGHQLMERCRKKGYPLTIPEEDIQPNVIHPVVHTHPHTKRKSIFVNWAHTDHIVGLPRAESDAILNTIYDHCRNPKFVYTHYYQKGDLAVWDNASTIHSNSNKKLSGARIMRRVMIKGGYRPCFQKNNTF